MRRVYVLQELFADAILVVVALRKEGLELVVDFEDLHLSFVLVREIGFGDGVAGERDCAERYLDVEGNGSQIQHVLQLLDYTLWNSFRYGLLLKLVNS